MAMTKPTQAQIKEARNLVALWLAHLWARRPDWLSKMPDRNEVDWLSDRIANEFAALAAAAEVVCSHPKGQAKTMYCTKCGDYYTAAAEVGDKRWQEIANQGIHIERQLRKELLTIEAATVERCAQVAETHTMVRPGYATRPATGQEIAAAIRALKDKP